MSSIELHRIDDDFRINLQDYEHKYHAITALPNRIHFNSWIRQSLSDATLNGQEMALLWIDVLNFRREYSVGGDEGTNRLVLNAADSLRPWAEAGELICHFGDDCFLLALKRDESIDARINLILNAAAHPTIRSTEGKPEIAAGVSYFPEHTSSPEELIRFACLAADAGTRIRSRNATVFAPAMNTTLQLERDLEKDLRRALRENEMSLAYQPQIELASGTILGVEALMRWTHPLRGHISPAEFIPIAERSDLIDEIFSYSLRQLLSDVAEWRKSGIVLPSAAVNASPANVRHEEFVSIVKRELAANPPGNTQLEIEVTESLLIDDEEMFIERLSELRSIGVKVSLDDFGTRYTGFNALKGLPLNTMKIDKCFVHGIDRSSQAQSLCRTIVTMARHLHLATLAEGIEEPGELKTLQELGCSGGQGYLFQRPVPSRQFLDFIRNWPERRLDPEFGGTFLEVQANSAHELEMVIGPS